MYSSENYHEYYFGPNVKRKPREKVPSRLQQRKKKKAAKEEKPWVRHGGVRHRRCTVCKKKINPGETICSSCQVVSL